MLGNTVLVNYGIQTETSDIRAHVCPVVKLVYLYKTSSGLNAINSHQYKTGEAYTNGIVTGVGYLVPPSDIEGIISVGAPDYWWSFFDRKQTTTKKGELAMRMVKKMILSGMIPLISSVMEITERDLQVSGADLLVRADFKIQVKCDFNGGDRTLGGTGNLFLQIMECNPFSCV